MSEALQAAMRSVLKEELMPAIKELNETVGRLSEKVDRLDGEVTGINNGMKAMLQANADRDGLIDQLLTRATHQAEALVGLRTAIHDYQKSVESTVDKLGKGVHLRLEKVEEWQVRHGGATHESEESAESEKVQAQ